MNVPNLKNLRKTLIVPSETQVREFDAKLFFACAAAERGFPSVVGSRYDIHLKIASLPRGIYVGKDIRGSSLKMFLIMKDLGYQIAAWDEEALVPYPPARYYQTRISSKALRRTAAAFAWGEENAELFRGFPSWGDVPIHVTGNPRFDILRRELRDFFAEDRDLLRNRYGDFILVNTNFGILNHYVPNLTSLLPVSDETGRKTDNFTAGLSAHRYAVFTHFQKMIPVLSERFPDFTVVIRPHPSENHEVWSAIAERHSNVRVVFEGSVVPWLLACRALVHNGCMTAIEAYVLDKLAVAYRPESSDLFEKELPNGVSVEVFDLEGLISTLGRIIECEEPLKTPERERLLGRHLTGIDGPFASERILDALAELDEQLDWRWPGVRRYLSGYYRASVRAYEKRRNANIPGHKNNLEYQRHRFPGLQLAEVQQRIARFGGLLGRFGRVRASQLHENIFHIHAE